MPPKLYKFILATVAALMLVGVSLVQNELVRQRDALGITKYMELKGAPPVLALTTVALGGFRGLISNVLWMRATDLQENDKFFEMVQLADWITKLEPHFTQVWLMQSWNMAYNISVKFKDPQDRWRWVQRGIELLRDDGLRYNPNDVLMYRELAWFFQHKMGANLDDAQMYYKQMWLKQMARVFSNEPPNWDVLINPATPEQKERVHILTNTFKLDPVFMKQVDDRYGPLEWRLPEAHAIYWAAEGLDAAKRNERKIDTNDLITLRRVIYQSMQLSFQRGRLVMDKVDRSFELGPNLAIIPHVSAAYEQAMDDDPKNRDHIETAHRNFLRDAIYFLYTYNREADALKWFRYVGQKYPDKPMIMNDVNSLPSRISLDEYALGQIQEEIKDLGRDRAEALIEGFEERASESLAVDEEDHYIGMERLAEKTWDAYMSKIRGNKTALDRTGLRPMVEIKKLALDRVLSEELSPQLAAVLRTKLGLPAPGKTASPDSAVPPTAPAGGPANTNAAAVPPDA